MPKPSIYIESLNCKNEEVLAESLSAQHLQKTYTGRRVVVDIRPYVKTGDGQKILAVLETMKTWREERFTRLEELLEEFGIARVRKSRGESLSGGERRRVEIARCLATEPQYILLDEPFAGIDPLAIDDIRDIILYLKKQRIGILITDHNVRETLGITDRAYIMTEGKILRSGRP